MAKKSGTAWLQLGHHRKILDVATGTAVLAIALSKTQANRIPGIDISQGMLDVGQKKLEERHLSKLITLQQADSEDLPFADNSSRCGNGRPWRAKFREPAERPSGMRRRIKARWQTTEYWNFRSLAGLSLSDSTAFTFKNILPRLGRDDLSRDNSASYFFTCVSRCFPHGKRFVEILR
ncbi:MAG: class I SAM-dependent methyltransferase [Owenweeksia sp.]|nr:class I SAM-dependent methyltransferase [Owenweeksia sp.]